MPLARVAERLWRGNAIVRLAFTAVLVVRFGWVSDVMNRVDLLETVDISEELKIDYKHDYEHEHEHEHEKISSSETMLV